MWPHQQAAQRRPRLPDHSAVGPPGGSCRFLVLVLAWQMAWMQFKASSFNTLRLGCHSLPACLSAQRLTDPLHALFCAQTSHCCSSMLWLGA